MNQIYFLNPYILESSENLLISQYKFLSKCKKIKHLEFFYMFFYIIFFFLNLKNINRLIKIFISI
jgi:hypothetical protein